MTSTYTTFDSGLAILSRKLPLLPQVDSLIFDIDGVVLDVKNSFRVAISQTVQFYFSQILQWPGRALLVSPKETQFFKLAGGFNNDWDLTFAAILFYLAQARRLESRDLDELRRQSDIIEFTRSVQAAGGGPEQAVEIALQPFDAGERGQILKDWDKKLIQRIFQEFYAGTTYCLELYGFEPLYVKEEGLIMREKILLDAELVRPWYPRVGVVTGRTRKEAEVALEISRLRELVPEEYLIADEGDHPRKPNPEVLRILGERMGSILGVYFGDTPDDLATVQSCEKLGIPSSFISCIIIHREGERELYLARGVDILARSANEVLVFLREAGDEES